MTERFQEVANEWMNTGGGCMVDITTVYDKQDKKLLYMLVNDECMALTTFDYVSNETPGDSEPDDYIIYSMDVSNFTTLPCWDNQQMSNMPDGYFPLFNHGLLSFIKNTFKYRNQLTRIALENLPLELYNEVSQEYADWLCDNGLLVTTDGDKIIVAEGYEEQDLDCNGRDAAKMKQLLEKMREDADIDEDHLAVFYDEEIRIIIKDQVFTLGMCASVWNGLIEYADYIISEQ